MSRLSGLLFILLSFIVVVVVHLNCCSGFAQSTDVDDVDTDDYDAAQQRWASEPYSFRSELSSDSSCDYVHGSSLSMQDIAQFFKTQQQQRQRPTRRNVNSGSSSSPPLDALGTNTYETAPVAKDDQLQVRYEQTQVASIVHNEGGQPRHVTGRFIRVANPLNHFSVLESASGCTVGKNTVRETLNLRKAANDTAYQCRVATNAGFFNTRNGSCYGNVISNSRTVQIDKKHNAQFGITKDGNYVVGYFDPSVSGQQTHESNLDQLISGVIWLVRDGENFVNESAHVEDMSFQETGDIFVTIAASRLAIGHDKDGRMLILQIDGDGRQEVRKGVNLYQLADWMIELGAVNAINLDGGGSCTVVSNGEVINAVTDGCNRNVIPYEFARCERAVATITCLHDIIQEEEEPIQPDDPENGGEKKDPLVNRLKDFLTTMGLLVAILSVVIFLLLLVIVVYAVRRFYRKHARSTAHSEGDFKFLLGNDDSDDDNDDLDRFAEGLGFDQQDIDGSYGSGVNTTGIDMAATLNNIHQPVAP